MGEELGKKKEERGGKKYVCSGGVDGWGRTKTNSEIFNEIHA